MSDNPPPTAIAVHPVVAGTVSVSAIAAAVFLGLQTFGVITPTQANNAKPIANEVALFLQPLIDKALAAKAAETVNQTKVVLPDPNKPIVVPVSPSLPTATIVTADSKGKPLPVDTTKQFCTAEPNKQFTLLSTGTVHAGKATSLAWTLLKSTDEDVDTTPFPASDGSGSTSGYAVTMRNGATLTVVVSATQGEAVSSSAIIIRCNQGGQPPPPVVTNAPPSNPPPSTPPTPTVVPGSKKFTLYVVEDASVKRTVTTATILNNLSMRTTLTNKGHSVITTTATASDPGATYLKTHPESMPALVVFDSSTQQFVSSVPLPTDLGLSLVTGMGG